MIDVDPEVIEKAKKRLLDLSSTWSTGLCRGDVWTLAGKPQGAVSHGACHSWVDYAYILERQKPKGKQENFLVLTCHSKARSKGVCSEEAVEGIIEWMASDESPFGKYILNRDDKDSLSNGGAVILCGPDGASQVEAMWMCKVLRYSTEGAQALDTWLTLYRGGVDPVFALVVSSYIRTVKGATFSHTGVCSHGTVFYGPSEETIQNVMSRKMDKSATSTYTLFSKKISYGDSPVTKKIKGFCKPYKKDDGWGGKLTGDGVSKEELISLVLEWQAEFTPKTGLEKVKALRKPPSKDTVYLDVDM